MVAAPPPIDRDSRRISGERTAPRSIPRPPEFVETMTLKERWEFEALIGRLKERVYELEQAMVDQRHAERQLSLYGSPRTLEEMATQVGLSPRFKDLTPAEHRYVASVGLASGLNPEFHLHAWKSGGKLLVMPDYKALITLSAQHRLMLKERRLTAEEMRGRGIPERDVAEGAIAFVVEGYELDLAILARRAGMDYEPHRGYGWWAAKKDETRWNNQTKKMEPTGKRIPNDVPHARDGEWVARKRAMRDLYHQFADLTLKFGRQAVPGATVIEDGDGWEFEESGADNVVEGEFSVKDAPAEWLKNPANVQRAEAARDERGVTDGQINEALGVEDWRRRGISPEEFKIVLEQLEAKPEKADSKQDLARDTTIVGCVKCGTNPANPSNPVDPTLCDACASAAADAQA